MKSIKLVLNNFSKTKYTCVYITGKNCIVYRKLFILDYIVVY